MFTQELYAAICERARSRHGYRLGGGSPQFGIHHTAGFGRALAAQNLLNKVHGGATALKAAAPLV